MIQGLAMSRAVRLVLASLIVFIMFELTRSGLADFVRLPATALIDDIQNTNRPFTTYDLNEAMDTLDLSGRIDPANPLIPEYRGHIYFLRARLAMNLPRLRDGYLEYARDEYLRALALRPNSAYLWSTLVIVDDRLLEQADEQKRPILEAELGRSILHACRLGPWEYPILSAVSNVADQHWSSLDAAQRSAVLTAKQRLASFQTQPVLKKRLQ
ncbi:MAG: hypothetical protein COS39_00955 [Hydrogenophilales bacterium CG03_land_8_20_14_0_80_62_28]|nr:MAG: hypothetical protein COS39_00955 [Hydrogenophilales bacterium CG03_land_8_20_14_0_80_62_28]PIY98216.1 MAG: hypothetical protein COY64_07180 [Hydrogenophilales bacterium CG_4_10_14_0_8_um_filter_62_70]